MSELGIVFFDGCLTINFPLAVARQAPYNNREQPKEKFDVSDYTCD
jgi:hypothetical protein